MTSGEVLYATDDNTNANYFGTDISWDSSVGWAMLLDDSGTIADFLAAKSITQVKSCYNSGE